MAIRRNPQGKYPAPSQSTFCRFFRRVDGDKINQAILAIQAQIRGPVPEGGLIVLEKGGDYLLTVKDNQPTLKPAS
jgi:hypothetical protein